MAGNDTPFSQEALPENRDGRLTDDQKRSWAQVALRRRKSTRGASYVVAAIGVVLLIASGPASKTAMRHAVGFGSLALACVILVAAGRDSVTADVRDGRVDAAEGAIAKHLFRGTGSSSNTTYYVDVAGRHLRAWRREYDAAPDAGIVRAFYLPRSRRLVNLERLADRPLPEGADVAQQVLGQVVAAVRKHDPIALAEARATAAALEDAIRGPEPHPAGAGQTRLTGEALRGSWKNQMMTVTFAQDGVATLSMFGAAPRVGRWSVDTSGRLLTDASGSMQPTDASVDDDRLTIAVGGQRVTFRRVSEDLKNKD